MYSLTSTKIYIGSTQSPLVSGRSELKFTGAIRGLSTVADAKLDEKAISSTDKTSVSSNTPKPQSILLVAVNRLSSIVNQLSELKDRKDSHLTEEQQGVINTEIANLQNEFNSITNDDIFSNIEKTIQNKFQGGNFSVQNAPDGLVSSLLDNGDTYRVTLLGSSISTLKGIDSSTLGTDSSSLEQAKNSLNGIIESLSNIPAKPSLEVKEISSPETTFTEIPIPELQTYDLPGELSLAFKSYSTRDLLLAAQSGMNIDPKSLVQILYDDNDKKSDRNKDDYNDDNNLLIESTVQDV